MLGFMAMPTIVSVAEDAITAVPKKYKEAALALGATRWQAIWRVVLRAASSGIVAAVMLGIGRVIGETMAVTMVIGNRPEIKFSLFEPGYTMAAVIANEFTEATSDLYVQTLIQVGLVLFVITIIVNGIARYLIYKVAKEAEVVA